MSGTVQLLNEQGLRSDGRRPNEIRKLNCKLAVFEQSDGSAYIEMGNTKVLAAVYGPHDTRVNKQSKGGSNQEKAAVNCQYSMATFSTNERKKKPRGDFRSIEIKNNLKEIFEAAILTSLYPHSQIDIYLEVLQSDGSNFAACVNAATLAIIHAGIAIKDIVCACSAALIQETPIIDVNYAEESLGSGSTPIMTVAILPKEKQILSLEETGRIHLDKMNQLMDRAMDGCQDVLHVMKATVLEFVVELND